MGADSSPSSQTLDRISTGFHVPAALDSRIVKGLMEIAFPVRTPPLTSSRHNRGAQKAFEEREQ